MNQNERHLKQAEIAGHLQRMRAKQFQLSDMILKGKSIADIRVLAEECCEHMYAAIKAYQELRG